LDTSGRAGGVHPAGLVDGIAPDVEDRLRCANHSANERADADTYTQSNNKNGI